MTVLTCPLCDTRVNAGAARCPECGADIHLDRAQAMVELRGTGRAAPCPVPARPMPKPGWSLSWRVVATLPGLIAPLWLTVRAAQDFVHEARWYFSLPVDVRTEDGDPFPASAGMYFAAFAIACGLMLVLLSFSLALPRRLWLWWGVVASFLALVVVCLLFALDAPVGFAYLYLPVLVAVRVVWQRRADGELASPPRLIGQSHT